MCDINIPNDTAVGRTEREKCGGEYGDGEYMNYGRELRIRKESVEKGKEKKELRMSRADKLDSCGIRAPLWKKKRFHPEILTDSGFYSVTPEEFNSYLTWKHFIPFLRNKKI